MENPQGDHFLWQIRPPGRLSGSARTFKRTLRILSLEHRKLGARVSQPVNLDKRKGPPKLDLALTVRRLGNGRPPDSSPPPHPFLIVL